MSPKISMGSMPDWPTDCALMMAVTNESSTMATETNGPNERAMQHTSAAAATNSASKPASKREK